MDVEEGIQFFISESDELLQEMELSLLKLESDQTDDELINGIFRAVHTIKGSAGLFGLERIISFTHVVEHVLDDVRKCLVPITTDLITLLMKCKDHTSLLIEAQQDNALYDKSAEQDEERLLIKLEQYAANTVQGSQELAAVDEILSEQAAVEHKYHISIRLGDDTFRQGFDLSVVLSQLAEAGELLAVIPVIDGLPVLQDMDSEACYLGWEVSIRTHENKNQIASIFEFMDESQVFILGDKACAEDFRKHIESLPEDESLIGEMLIKAGSITKQELDHALKRQKLTGERTGDILVDEGSVNETVVDAALKKQQGSRQVRSAANSIRVQSAKLDQLVNEVGELITKFAAVHNYADKTEDDELLQLVKGMSQCLEDVRESSLGLRMVPIGDTFNIFRRVVRDLSKDMSKSVSLEIRGGDAELDKTFIERLHDPLVHLIRNSMDHGLEGPDERIAAGKSPKGSIKLNAYHETGAIVISIEDDGRGLDKEKILQKAIDNELVKEDAELSDHEIYQLIFEPGFSTAVEVSNISGRGVGMDVVRKNIESLRGTITLDSIPGEGTTTIIRLPLTLAIIDGFHVSIGGESFIIPLEMITECISLPHLEDDQRTGRETTNLRNEVLPVIQLNQLFGLTESKNKSRKRNVVVVDFADQKAGFEVEELHGEVQAVMKPLGQVFHRMDGFAGFTVLGSGNAALILDVGSILSAEQQGEKRRSIRAATIH